MKVKNLVAREIKDTRREKTIEVKLITNDGEFIASAPNGKSRGEFEAKVWKKSLAGDIKAVNNYFIEDILINNFDDLVLIENAFSDRVGGNTMIALEYCFLKALAKQEDKQVWELINPRASKMPVPIGNIIGGGKHSASSKSVFQEFHIIPVANSFELANKILKRADENADEILRNTDSNFKGKLNDENAWISGLNEEKIIEVMDNVKENMIEEFGCKVHIGIDVAASSFYKNGNYIYKNGKKNVKKQIEYMKKLSDKFYYLEDPLEENDFKGFSEILKKSKGLIVGDDLTVTNLERLEIAVKNKSINAIIIKPNQVGSLIEIKKIVSFCKKNNIKMIFSHRSGETKEDIISDLAFGFGADFVKFGALGKGRDEKLQRLIEIEKSL